MNALDQKLALLRGGDSTLPHERSHLLTHPDVSPVLDAVGVPLYVTDAEGRMTYYNDAAAALWGWKPPLGGRPCDADHRVLRPDGSVMPWAESALAQALEHGRPVAGHRAVRERPDGSSVSLEAYATPVRNGLDELTGAVVILIDVTERELASSRAQEAGLAKTRFLAAMSHELRTPIHVVLGFADLLAEAARSRQCLTAEHGEWIAEVQGAGRHLLELVSDAIAFAEATIADTRPVLRRRATRLGSIVSDAVATAAKAFAMRGLSVAREGPDMDPTAALDPAAARHALLSVLRELARHMPEGGCVHVGWGETEDESAAYISLRCPGLAMPPDLLDQLDAPFAGFDRDLYSRGLEGAGLSVATAAALIRGHGGDLRITGGHDGQPSSFWLTFPTVSPGPDALAGSTDSQAAREAPGAERTLSTPPPSRPKLTFSLADVVAAVVEMVVVTAADVDPPGPTIVYVNPAFTSVTGYAPEEVLGRTPRLLQGPETSRAVLDRIREDLCAGRETRATVVNYTRAGRPYWVEMHIVPLRDAGGEITHFAAIERVVDGEWGSGGSA